MNKLILKTAIITAASVAAATLLVFSLWILCSPQSMASVSEKTGNYSFAVTCADLRYKYTKNADDLARCAEDAIMSGKDKLIVKYCEKLIADDGFESVCTKKDEKLSSNAIGDYKLSYNAFVRGNLAAAEYRTGNTDTAIDTASKGGDQSFIKLVIAVSEANDKAAAEQILAKLNEDGVEDVDGNLESLKNILNNLLK